jgi:predicted  nucleic acid-binding Zn-ribbon protein
MMANADRSHLTLVGDVAPVSERISAQKQQANTSIQQFSIKSGQFQASLMPKNADAANKLEPKMNGPTREEVDAKLDVASARAETRFVELSAKIDRLADSIANLNSNLTKEITTVSAELKEVKADNKDTRYTIIITVIAATIAALAALWTTQSNLISAFQTGASIRSEQTIPPSSSKK